MELRVSVSRRGDIVYALASAVRNRSHLVVVNWRTGERSILPSPPGVRLFPDLRLSPDGKRLAVSGTRDVNHEIWLYQLATNQVEAFTVDGTQPQHGVEAQWRRADVLLVFVRRRDAPGGQTARCHPARPDGRLSEELDPGRQDTPAR